MDINGDGKLTFEEIRIRLPNVIPVFTGWDGVLCQLEIPHTVRHVSTVLRTLPMTGLNARVNSMVLCENTIDDVLRVETWGVCGWRRKDGASGPDCVVCLVLVCTEQGSPHM